MVNLEAMACGAAVVASATGGVPRSSPTAEPEPWSPSAGHRRHRNAPGPPGAVDFAAALTDMVSDPSALAASARPGRRRVRSTSWESIARPTLEVYRLVL
ncbi:hypothetical protein QJS66_03430 [Kocuria rhizophila]|nr:hypothetical protein QJS66_03430 [Kocuria rhizophila]